MKIWTNDDLPPVIWNVHVAGHGGLGLSDAAQANYFWEVEKRIALGAEVLGTVREQEMTPGGVVLHEPTLVSDTPLRPKFVPCLISHFSGRRNRSGSHLAEFNRLDHDIQALRAARRLRRRQVDPVILGTGFPDALGAVASAFRGGDHVDAVADYLEDGFALQIDDAMGRPEELGAIVDAAREQAGLSPSEGIVIGETATLNNRARWNKSTDYDRGALVESGIPWIIRAGTFGRSVLLDRSVNIMNPNLPPIYLLVTGQDHVTADEVAEFRLLGYDRFVLQGIGIGSPVAAAAREILKNWRETRKLEPGVIPGPVHSAEGRGA